jgi:transposase-like protein
MNAFSYRQLEEMMAERGVVVDHTTIWRWIQRQDWPPHVINTDKNPTYGEALRQLKRDDPEAESIEHRQAKYHNNRIEADHGPIKLSRPITAR